ncbi:MAG: hypothetical protein NT015_11660 [Alphaproteobacteria bacterium]|nr:hypothetical protein [Alphaproteobacteria bacterium]
MPNATNRRAEAEARGLLKRSEQMLGRACQHLFNGDPLVAMRMLRAAEQLNQLDSRLRTKREAERTSLAARTANDLKKRERACERREELLENASKDVAQRHEDVRQAQAALNATYELMRAGKVDGPPPATETETVSGVAPL